MPLFMRVNGRDIPMGLTYDNEADLKHSGDFPERFFEIWAEKGKLYIQSKVVKSTQTMRTPNKGLFY